MTSADDVLLAHAYVDGELDAMSALAVEKRIAIDPAFAARCRAIASLQQLVRQAAVLQQASPDFRAEMAALAKPPKSAVHGWRGMAMAASLAAVVASGATFLALEQNRPDEIAASILTAHIRGLASPQPLDVISTDRHTVKPWFDGRLAFSPLVVDTAAEGFPLVGGRMDAVGGQLAATMVYHAQQHVITLTQARSASLPGFSRSILPKVEQTRDGYSLLTFVHNDLTCWVVTDVPMAQARSFVAAWQASAARL